MRASASGVSRTLAIGGRRPLGSGASQMREGLRVRRGGPGAGVLAYVRADYDSDRAAARALVDVVEILTTAGYAVEVSDRIATVKIPGATS